MANINTQISNLLTTLGAPAPAKPNTLLVTTPNPFDLSVLGQSATAVHLTDAEAAIAGPTVQRVVVGNQLNEYMLYIIAAYMGLNHTRTLPDWLKQQGDEDQYFADFTAGLQTADPAIAQQVETNYGITRAQFDTLYTRWKDLRGEEQLAKSAREKVRNGVDLRACLSKALRYYGYTDSEVEGIMNSGQ